MLKKLLTTFLILSFVVQFSVPVAMMCYHSYTQKKTSKIGEKFTFNAKILSISSDKADLNIDFFGDNHIENEDNQLEQAGIYGILKTDKNGIAMIDRFSTEKPTEENYIEVPEDAKEQLEYFNSAAYTAHGNFQPLEIDIYFPMPGVDCTVTAYLLNGKLTLDRLYIDGVYAEDIDWSEFAHDKYAGSITEVNSNPSSDPETTAPETGAAA